MRMKQILSLALSAALVCALLVFPAAPAAAAGQSAFSDITDAGVAQAAETLRLLGIVGGTGAGAFEPGRTLTRAEFCKIAVELMGKGDLVSGHMSRTVFKDVPANHWARGYISVATQTSSSGGGDKDTPTVTTPGIIRGDAYGNFNPDRPITYAEAVTILTRILGYGDSDVGLVWPNGYLAMAKSLELTDGLTLAAGDSLTRGQAVLLLENLLYIKPKDAKDEYLVSKLGCTITAEAIVFAVDAVAPDGSKNAVKTGGDKTQVYKTDRVPFSDDLVGRRAKLVLDKDEKVVAAQVSQQGTQRVVGILSTGYNFVKLSGGEEVKIAEAGTPVYRDGQDNTTFEKIYLNLTPGSQAVLQYSAAGELEYLFLRSASKVDDSTRVLKTKPSPSAVEPGYAIYKNGLPATTKDYRQYDVTTFDAVSNIMYVSDSRVTGIYENVYPNTQTPAKVTVMGREFDVLPSAATDLSAMKLGQSITLLLSHTGQVAGAVDPGVAKSTTVGQVTSISDGKAVVTAINLRDASGAFMKFEGETSYTGDRAKEMEGQLVTISSGAKGCLSMSKLSGSDAQGPLDIAARRVGSATLAENVLLYEHAGPSKMSQIKLDDITLGVVPTERITYIHKNYAGNIDVILLNDVTGDRYDYGFVSFTASKSHGSGVDDGFDPATITISNGVKGAGPLECSIQVGNGTLGGIVAKPNGKSLASYVELEKVTDVRSSAFDMENMTITTNSAVYHISSQVQCYNKTTDTWFTVGENPTEEAYKAALNQARAFSDTLTLYLDKSPDEGGKVRIIVVE